MGTVYYMAREDGDLQLYELGKVPFWHGALGEGEPIVIREDDRPTVFALSMGWSQGFTEPVEDGYFEALVRDLARWSEGKPMRFIAEHAVLIERWQDARPAEHCTRFPPVTGDRYRVASER